MPEKISDGIYTNDEEFCLKNGIPVKDIKENIIYQLCKCGVCQNEM